MAQYQALIFEARYKRTLSQQERNTELLIAFYPGIMFCSEEDSISPGCPCTKAMSIMVKYTASLPIKFITLILPTLYLSFFSFIILPCSGDEFY